MKAAFDTSVLVAALVPSHVHHARAYPWLNAVGSGALSGVVSAHALAEMFSVMTKIPLSPPITPAQGAQMIERLRPFFLVVEEDEGVAAAAVARCAAVGAATGAVFDAIHIVTAERAGVDVVVTFNERHFRRLSTTTTPRIVVPPDPPAVVL